MNTATVSCNARFTRRCSDVAIEPKMWEKDGKHHELYMSKNDIPLVIGDCSVQVILAGTYPAIIINGNEVDIDEYLTGDDSVEARIESADGIYNISFVRYVSTCRLDMSHSDGENEVKWCAIKIMNK